MNHYQPDRRRFIKTAALAMPGLAVSGVAPNVEAASNVEATSNVAPPRLPMPTDDWEAIRNQYDLWNARTYLNSGGLGPSPRPVLQRFREVTDDLQHRSETGHNLIEDAREPVARFFGAYPEEIAFTRNATEGNAIVASGLSIEARDEIIIDSHAHPGGAIPWLNRWKLDGVIVKTFDPSATDADGIVSRIAALMTSRTRAIQVSHVTAPTGILLPVNRIARLAADSGCWFHIDGAQSAGMMSIDLHAIGCNSWASSGHKWLGAPHGTGVLFIRKDGLDRIRPTEVGAYSDAGYALPAQLDYIETARRHESGTRNAPLVDGIRSACAFMDAVGMDRVRNRGLELTSRLRRGLASIEGIELLTPHDDALRGSILTFRSDRMPNRDLYQRLSREHQLRLRIVTEVELNAIRISLHIFNSESDVDRVIEGVRAVLG